MSATKEQLLRRKLSVPQAIHSGLRRGTIRLLPLPVDETSRAIKRGSFVDFNESFGTNVVDVTDFPSVEAAFAGGRHTRFFSASSASEAADLWKRYMGRTKPNGAVRLLSLP